MRTTAIMGSAVRIEVVGQPTTDAEREHRDQAIDRAVEWFRAVEHCCSRVDASSEVRELAGRTGEQLPVSAMLAGTMRFALALAEETTGAFDPTVGQGTGASPELATWRDVFVDPQRNVITLQKPMLLDLGAIAKGLALDLAARELRPLGNFAIDAGGALYLSGMNSHREPWRVAIRHPRSRDEILQALRVSRVAVCTSDDSEGPTGIISATVIAPSAMVADGLATAASLLRPRDGIALLERHGVDGLVVTTTLERHTSAGMRSYFTDAAG